MLELCHRGLITIEEVCAKMCHAPANCFQISQRGYIQKDYWADLVIVDPEDPWTVQPSNLHYKCGWSPFEDQLFHSKVTHTFVNGNLVYKNNTKGNGLGDLDEASKGMRLTFDR